MFINLRKKLLPFAEYLLTLKHLFKLSFFKSPMDINSSLKYFLYQINSQIIFRFKGKRNSHNHKREARQFISYGYSTFYNKNIEKNSKAILEKISLFKEPWDQNNELKVAPSNVFKQEFINIFKSGVDDFVKSAFKSDYKIFYHLLYISKRESMNDVPINSALWHGDGGPGICMNLMICHTPINILNGSMKIIPWKVSKILLTKTFFKYKKWLRNFFDKNQIELNRNEFREVKCNLLKELIEENKITYFQPYSKESGLIYAFRNNCVHAGGFTENGHERVVSILHLYPSNKITSLEEKFSSDHIKFEPYLSPNKIFKD